MSKSENQNKKKIPLINARVYYPDHWGEIQKFSVFCHETYQFSKKQSSDLRGISGHLDKSITLFSLFNRQIPSLQEDKEELEKTGYTPANRSKELAAIVEAIFCELYSSVDCTKSIIFAIYGKYRGITSKSTSRLFRYALEDKIDERVPKQLREILKNANWFPRLHLIRTTVVHSNVGSCHEDEGKIRYFHELLRDDSNSLAITNTKEELQSMFDAVNYFIGALFNFLSTTLIDSTAKVVCCMTQGRMYMRKISSRESLDLENGVCISQWFLNKESPQCPFSDNCKPLMRAKQVPTDVST